MMRFAPELSWYYGALSAFDGARLTGHFSLPASSFSMKGPRARNEDRTFMLWCGPRHDRPAMLAVGLLDGIGGAKAGDVAASVAAAHFLAAFVEGENPIATSGEIEEALEAALSRANTQVCDIFNGTSGTTLTAFAMNRDCCVAVHVGDSRFYGITPGFVQVTRDDTASGLLGGEAPDLLGGALLQFVGIGPAMLHQSYDLSDACPKRLLLTSDGLHTLGPRTLRRLLLHGPWTQERTEADEAYWKLQDNASAVLVRTEPARIELDRLAPCELRLICGHRRASFIMGQAPDNQAD